jgi:hemin uptake protein HemP
MNPLNIDHNMNAKTGDELHALFAQLPIKLVSSENLFGMGKEILIQHRGEQYHLRVTRNDKLILTK